MAKKMFFAVYEGQLQKKWIEGLFLSYLHSSRIPQGQEDQAHPVDCPAVSSSSVLWKKHGVGPQGHWAASSYVPLTVYFETTPEKKGNEEQI